jgi:prepilin-type N-terminal cleavage/methylation domain-containing protein
MSRISVHRTKGGRRGFTLVEVLIATSLSAVILAAVFSAYLFLGRNLTRLVNVQQQDVASRSAVRQFTQDVSAAVQLTTATSSQIVLTKPSASGTTTVSYVYSAADRTLTRVAGSTTRTLLSGLTDFTVAYFNSAGGATANPGSVKAVELSFTTAAGSDASGTRARYASVSPRVILRNKPSLE